MALVTKNFSDIITFTRASTATFFNSAGVLTSAAINAPRFDYNPSTLAAQGLLIEEQRTNLLLQSGWAGAVGGSPGTAPTSWTIGFGTGADTTLVNSIYGTAEQAIKFDANATERIMYQQSFSVTNGVQYAASVFIEAVSGVIGDTIAVTNGTGTATQNTFVTSPSTPGRYTILFTATATGTVNIRYGIGTTAGVAGTCSVTMSRPQVEAGAFPTSYIPTTTTALTRSADVASVNTLSPWYNASAGTLYAEILRQTTTGYPGRARFSDGTANNAIDLYYDAAANSSTFEIKSGGTTSAQIYGGGGALNTVVKAAAAWETNNAAVVYDGSVVGTDTSVVVPSGINQIRFANALTGYLRRLTYYPRRLSNAELVSITS